MTFNAGIIGTGAALPEKVLTNHDLEKFLDTSDEWIRTRTGIEQRTVASPGETNSKFGAEAARMAMDNANITAEEIDILIYATVTPDMPLPSTACIVQSMLGAKNAAAFDISAACSGFIYALTIAEKFVRTGAAKNVLIVGAEVLTRWVDWKDRTTAVLFADGAGAAVVSQVEAPRGILASNIHSDGDFVNVLNIPAGGSADPFSQEVLDERRAHIKMRGNELFKVAVRSMARSSREALEEAGVSTDEIKMLFPHQANQRITQGVGSRLKLEDERVYQNIHRLGNSSAATIPISLHEYVSEGRAQEGDIFLLTAFGGGVTWGSLVMRW